jgi:excisionase family DNA binding protein
MRLVEIPTLPRMPKGSIGGGRQIPRAPTKENDAYAFRHFVRHPTRAFQAFSFSPHSRQHFYSGGAMSKRQCDIAPRWLDLYAASRYCSLHRQTLVRHINAGEVYARRIGGKWLVDRQSIDSWLLSDKIIIARRAKTR